MLPAHLPTKEGMCGEHHVAWLQVEVPGLQWKRSGRGAGRDHRVPGGPCNVSAAVHGSPPSHPAPAAQLLPRSPVLPFSSDVGLLDIEMCRHGRHLPHCSPASLRCMRCWPSCLNCMGRACLGFATVTALHAVQWHCTHRQISFGKVQLDVASADLLCVMCACCRPEQVPGTDEPRPS